MLAQFVINGIVIGSMYALIGLSFTLIYALTRFFHFAHGAVFAWGAYFCFFMHAVLGLPLILALLVAATLSAGLAMIMELAIYRPARLRGASSLVLLIMSLGLYVILQNLISLCFGDEAKSIRSEAVREGMMLFGARITDVQVWMLISSVLCFMLIVALLQWTRVGKSFRATASNPELATAVGIDTDRLVLCAFAVGSGLVALASVLLALDTSLTPTMGLNALMMGIVTMVIGGVGRVRGTLPGGVLLGLAQQLGILKAGSEWQEAIAFVILLILLLLRPQGLMGGQIRKTVG